MKIRIYYKCICGFEEETTIEINDHQWDYILKQGSEDDLEVACTKCEEPVSYNILE